MADRGAQAELSTEPLILSLDVGTSSVRALLFDHDARPLPGSETKVEYAPRIGPDGTAEVEIHKLEGLALRAISGTVGLAARGAVIAAVGVSTFWHGVAGLDAHGRPTTPLILWMDTRSRRQAQALRQELDAEAVRARTGCPIHPSYWPAKLAWLRQSAPEVWSRTRRWVSFGDLLYQRLFGELATSPSMASGTGLRLLAGGWDAELLERLGVPEQSLPQELGEMCGLKPGPRRRWPQLSEATWLTAAGDGALANLGSGCVDPSRRALTIGTSGALRAMTDRLPGRLAHGLWCYLLEPGQYVVGGSLSNGGNLYAWLVSTLRLEERGLEQRLGRMRPASTGLTFLPLLGGERSLGFAPNASGAIAGLTQATTADEIARAGMEAVALTFAGVDRALDQTVPGAMRLVASGAAIVSSPVWAQMMADAIGKPLAVSYSAMEASSQGAAELALRHLGLKRRPRRQPGRNVEPRESARAAYEEAYRRQRWLYSAVIEGSS
ncbi:MAG TPA: gluconokinase [Candidatus Dormibacteraeota bacterium]|nr:gluconokinase [Candidatus Dormibacteraeota bacterium]